MLAYEIIDAEVSYEHHHVKKNGEREIDRYRSIQELKIVKIFGIPVLYVTIINNDNRAAHIYEYTDKKGELLKMMINNPDIDMLCNGEGWLNMNMAGKKCERNLKIL